MKFKFQYCFPCLSNGALAILNSGETAETLRNRVKKAPDVDKAAVEYLINANHVGNYATLSTGEFIFQCAV